VRGVPGKGGKIRSNFSPLGNSQERKKKQLDLREGRPSIAFKIADIRQGILPDSTRNRLKKKQKPPEKSSFIAVRNCPLLGKGRSRIRRRRAGKRCVESVIGGLRRSRGATGVSWKERGTTRGED